MPCLCCQVMWIWQKERVAVLFIRGCFDGCRLTATTEMCWINVSKTCVRSDGITHSQCMWEVPQSHINWNIKLASSGLQIFHIVTFQSIFCISTFLRMLKSSLLITVHFWMRSNNIDPKIGILSECCCGYGIAERSSCIIV